MGYWPFLMVGLAGYWELSDTQIPNMNSLMGDGGGLAGRRLRTALARRDRRTRPAVNIAVYAMTH